MYLYETHMHTSPVSACAMSSPVEQVRAYKARGYAGIIITDHFINGNSSCPYRLPWDKKMEYIASGYEKAKKEGERLGLSVFFGWEYANAGTEFLTYGLSLDFLLKHPKLDVLSIEEYSALVRKNSGYLAQAHPFRDAYWIANPYPVKSSLVDGIEIYNATMPDKVNAKAYDFARLHNLPVQAGSDSHHTRLAFSSGVTLSKRADSIFDIINAIKSGQAGLVTPDLGVPAMQYLDKQV